MGIAVWATAGLISFGIVRFIRIERRSWIVELAVSVLTALAAGVLATAFDFGGWAIVDGRAFAFCALSAFLALGVLRSRKRQGRHPEAWSQELQDPRLR